MYFVVSLFLFVFVSLPQAAVPLGVTIEQLRIVCEAKGVCLVAGCFFVSLWLVCWLVGRLIVSCFLYCGLVACLLCFCWGWLFVLVCFLFCLFASLLGCLGACLPLRFLLRLLRSIV